MTRRNALLVLLLVAVAAGWLLARGPAAPTGALPTAVDAPPAPGRVDATTPPIAEIDAPATDPSPAASAPLPPADALPGAVIAALAHRAEGGDSRAACRVAIELLACDQAETYARDYARAAPAREAEDAARAARHERAGRPREVAVDPAAAAAERRERQAWEARQRDLLASCATIPPALRSRMSDYLTSAARAGIAEAMIRYVDGHHLYGGASFDFLAHPGFEAWRREAPAMLQRLLQAGEPEAAFLLWVGHSPINQALLAGLIPDDPQQALAYHHLMARLGSGVEPIATQGLDARGQQRARELSARWHREYFDNRRASRDVGLRRLQGHHLSAAPAGDTHIPCAD